MYSSALWNGLSVSTLMSPRSAKGETRQGWKRTGEVRKRDGCRNEDEASRFVQGGQRGYISRKHTNMYNKVATIEIIISRILLLDFCSSFLFLQY